MIFIINDFQIHTVVLYSIMCYIYYRIARKFDNDISYVKMLVPFLNYIYLYRIAFSKPHSHYYFWGFIITAYSIGIVGAIYSGTNFFIFEAISIAIISLAYALPMSLIAKKLGKNFWVYFIFMLLTPIATSLIYEYRFSKNDVLTLPLLVFYLILNLNIAPSLILAFDSSEPTPPANEETT